MTVRDFLLFAAAALLLSGCATTPRRPPPSIEEIVQLSQQGVPPEQIIQQMRDTHAVYRLPASELARLKQRGVADPVLDYMQQTYLEDERWRAYSMYGPYWGWGPYGYWWGPPPVIVVRGHR